MIGIEGQFLVRISANGFSDFIDKGNLIQLVSEEAIFPKLPAFKLECKIRDEALVSQLKEGQVITVSFGKDSSDMKDCKVHIFYQKMVQVTAQEWLVIVAGFSSAPAFMSDPKIEYWDDKTSMEVIKEVAERHFTWYGENTGVSTDDQMIWLKTNVPDRTFLFDVLTHSYVQDNSLMAAITRDGQFILKDVKGILGSGFKAQFHQNDRQAGPLSIIYDTNFAYTSHSGVINEWVGYGININEHDILKGSEEMKEYLPSIGLSLSGKFEQRSAKPKPFLGQFYKSRNTHEKYLEAFLQNLITCATLSTNQIDLNYSKQYDDLHPLDLVNFKTSGLSLSGSVAEHISGPYIVGRIRRIITVQEMRSVVSLFRETTNDFSAKE